MFESIKVRRLCHVFLLFALVARPSPRSASNLTDGRPIWSKKGVSFYGACGENSIPCNEISIFSPDHKSWVVVGYKPDPEHPEFRYPSLTVFRAGRLVGSVKAVGLVQDEIVWAPDSQAFFVNGNNNANSDYHVAVHRLEDPHLGPDHITEEVEKDMVRSFPPCRAKNPLDNCAEVAEEREYFGVAGLDWIGASEIVVMAEVNESSMMGGIRGQVLGYEIEVPNGRIVRRLEPRELAQRWQHSMAWKFRIPDPPEFSDR